MDHQNARQTAPNRARISMQELLKEYDKTVGMTIKDFCELRQVNKGSFYAARKRLRSAAKTQSSGFVALTQAASREPSGGLFAEVNGIRLYQAVSAEYLKALVV